MSNNPIEKKPVKGVRKRFLKIYNEFHFTSYKNYPKTYEYNETSITINALPVIVKLKKKEGKAVDLLKMRRLNDCLNKDLKVASFKFKHAKSIYALELIGEISLLLGIKKGLKILEEDYK